MIQVNFNIRGRGRRSRVPICYRLLCRSDTGCPPWSIDPWIWRQVGAGPTANWMPILLFLAYCSSVLQRHNLVPKNNDGIDDLRTANSQCMLRFYKMNIFCIFCIICIFVWIFLGTGAIKLRPRRLLWLVTIATALLITFPLTPVFGC